MDIAMPELTKTEQSLIADEYQGYGLRENAKRHGLTLERARSILREANKKIDTEQDICEACDGTGQILKHPAGVRTTASYAVTCGACFGKGQYKSINASERQEKPVTGEYYPDLGSFVDGIVDTASCILDSKPNTAPASGVTSQDSIERAIK